MASNNEYHKIYQRYLYATKKAGYWYQGISIDEMKVLESEGKIVVSQGRKNNPYLPTVLPRKLPNTRNNLSIPVIDQYPDRSLIKVDQYQHRPLIQVPPETYDMLRMEYDRKVWEQENLRGLNHTGGKELPQEMLIKITNETANIYFSQVRRNTLARYPHSLMPTQVHQETRPKEPGLLELAGNAVLAYIQAATIGGDETYTLEDIQDTLNEYLRN